MKMPRDKCPLCGGDVALTTLGFFRAHRAKNHELYGAPGRGPRGSNDVPWCDGSRARPVEAAAIAAFRKAKEQS